MVSYSDVSGWHEIFLGAGSSRKWALGNFLGSLMIYMFGYVSGKFTNSSKSPRILYESLSTNVIARILGECSRVVRRRRAEKEGRDVM
jgi:hypothetical protein